MTSAQKGRNTWDNPDSFIGYDPLRLAKTYVQELLKVSNSTYMYT